MLGILAKVPTWRHSGLPHWRWKHLLSAFHPWTRFNPPSPLTPRSPTPGGCWTSGVGVEWRRSRETAAKSRMDGSSSASPKALLKFSRKEKKIKTFWFHHPVPLSVLKPCLGFLLSSREVRTTQNQQSNRKQNTGTNKHTHTLLLFLLLFFFYKRTTEQTQKDQHSSVFLLFFCLFSTESFIVIE